MSNYLERVAASAGRKGAGAIPPGIGPPLLPTSAGFSAISQELWPTDEHLSGETIDRHPDTVEPERPNKSLEGSLRPVPTEDAVPHTRSSTTPPRPQVSSPVALKNESQLAVHLPKTLRPIAVDQVAHLGPSEHASDAIPARAGTVSTPFVPDPGLGPGLRFLSPKPVERAVSSASETTVRLVKPTTPKVSPREHVEGSQPRPVKQIEIEKGLSDAPDDLSVPGLETKKLAVDSATSRAEPQPALAIQLPPVLVSGANRKPEPRVSIGHLEVMVNNHSTAEPVQQRGSPPPRSAAANLERRYLDRFRLRR